MSQPTRRKAANSQTRARRDSARLSAESSKKSSAPPKAKKSQTAQSAGLNSPILWTKDTPKKSESSLIMRILKGIGSFLFLIITTIFKALKTGLTFIVNQISRSKIAITLSLLAAVILVGGLIDLGLNGGKAYPGVFIGDIEVGGKTAKELEKLVEDTYASRLSDTTIYIFANEEASKDLEGSLAQTNDAAYAEQHSAEEAQARKLVWETDASMLGATLDTRGIVNEALAYGRENGGIINRISALFSGHTIDPRATYDIEKLEDLASDIDETIGNPRLNYDIIIDEGIASVSEGHDGDMINRDAFTNKLNGALLEKPDTVISLVAETEYAPLQITHEKAQSVCDRINKSIALGVRFVYNDTDWEASSKDLGDWLKTKVVETEEGWELEPYLDYNLAKGAFTNHLKASFSEETIKVHFSVDKDIVTVLPESQGSIPQSKDAIQALSAMLFQEKDIITSKPVIEVGSSSIPDSMSLQDALDVGVITVVSEFTTEYASGIENRNHNIHLAADLLNDTIISANGGEWSFNETAGEATEEVGYKGAGTILDGEIVDDVGGGICQVATTVFNSVYNAGYPILQRHNHSLYIASYPLGLDAAVSYPHLDLRWKNDTSSDVLLATSYTDFSVTVTLYGVDPEYQVSTVTGDWEVGEKFKTKTTLDETMTPGTSYVKTYGSDGSKITVYQTVKDKEGNTLREANFVSVYTPRDEVIIEGPPVKEKPAEDAITEKTAETESSETETLSTPASNT